MFIGYLASTAWENLDGSQVGICIFFHFTSSVCKPLSFYCVFRGVLKHLVNVLPKVVGFLQALQFSSAMYVVRVIEIVKNSTSPQNLRL